MRADGAGEFFCLRLIDVVVGFQQQPRYAFAARRCGQRTGKAVVFQPFRQQGAGVEGFVEVYLSFFHRHHVPYRSQAVVGFAGFVQYCQYQRLAVFVQVDEVGFHWEGAAFDLVFTGYVEMELFQGVGATVHAEGIAAFGVVDLDGVAVVFHVNRARLVIDFDGGQSAGDGFGNVDGGLVFACRA